MRKEKSQLWKDKHRATHLKHGHARVGHYTYLYRCHTDIKRRILNTKSKDYSNYGGRGLTMDEEWAISPGGFEHFRDYILSELGERPEGMSIDRINNDLGYIKGNLKWSTQAEQCRNRRSRWRKTP